MKRKGLALLAIAVLALLAVSVAGAKSLKSSKQTATTITGAGATFVSPLVSVWTPALGSAFDYTVQYSAVGSGGGIQAITNRTVDFGASDAPLTTDQFNACNGCVQIPWALAGTAVAYNIPGLNVNLRLSGNVIARMYMGEITNWNDAAIKVLNPKATLPDLKVTPVYRNGNSGTTYNFTDYLSSVSASWKSRLGTGQSVAWPAGVGANGSVGVAGVVQNTPGALCYAETGFAITSKLKFASIQNRAGKFIYPSIRNVTAAGSAVTKVPANNEMHIVNPPKTLPTAYPISTYTYIILPMKSGKAAELRKMVYWALTSGQKKEYTAKLWFAPIPLVVQSAAYKTLKLVTPAT